MLPEEIHNKSILISPLDWGMGHLTRCVPILDCLIERENHIIFAGTAFQCEWISRQFPQLVVEVIEGFNIQLDTGKSTYIQMISQSAKLRRVYKQEQEDAERLSLKHKVDIVISDNRYGFRSTQCHSIIMTHQLSPPIPTLRKIISKKIISWVNKFDTCWIPDEKRNPLCLELHNQILEIPKTMIGWQSRFKELPIAQKYDCCFIASGPSPQIEKFAEKMNEILKDCGLSYVLVVPYDMKLDNQVVNPSSENLNELIAQSTRVISRAGYTTIMELCFINKSGILIPTPGQFEQEYFAKNITQANLVFCKLSDLKAILNG